MTLVQTPPKKIYIWVDMPNYLCFTANTAGSTVKLQKSGNPTSVTLETSTDGSTWNTYTLGTTITLSNVGDEVYWRNTSETTTGFSTSFSNYYHFALTGSIAASGDINYLLNKNSTTTVGDYCFTFLFGYTSYGYGYDYALTTPPSLPATTLGEYCYSYMFQASNALVALPSLSATILPKWCYNSMFRGCPNIKLSTTQTGDYQTPYRIPATGTGTAGSASLDAMFENTGGPISGSPVNGYPSINTTYYTSNTVV